MQPQQISLLRQSFAQLEPIAPQAAALFYDNLFTADPSLRPMFRGDMNAQGAKLMQMIGAAVGLLDKPEILLPVLRKLGERHGAYGVQASHYLTVGSALVRTLEAGLGDAFTHDLREAWITFYELASRTMMAAAHTAMPVPRPIVMPQSA